MVNDKMVNGFMKKKQYISPLTEATSINSLLMALTGPASVLPGAGAQAPARRSEVF